EELLRILQVRVGVGNLFQAMPALRAGPACRDFRNLQQSVPFGADELRTIPSQQMLRRAADSSAMGKLYLCSMLLDNHRARIGFARQGTPYGCFKNRLNRNNSLNEMKIFTIPRPLTAPRRYGLSHNSRVIGIQVAKKLLSQYSDQGKTSSTTPTSRQNTMNRSAEALWYQR